MGRAGGHLGPVGGATGEYVRPLLLNDRRWVGWRRNVHFGRYCPAATRPVRRCVDRSAGLPTRPGWVHRPFALRRRLRHALPRVEVERDAEPASAYLVAAARSDGAC